VRAIAEQKVDPLMQMRDHNFAAATVAAYAQPLRMCILGATDAPAERRNALCLCTHKSLSLLSFLMACLIFDLGRPD